MQTRNIQGGNFVALTCYNISSEYENKRGCEKVNETVMMLHVKMESK